MSHTYVVTLLVVVAAAFTARLVLPILPVRRYVVRLSVPDATAVVVGSFALILHCGAMFFRAFTASWPGGASVIRIVDPMGTASITWFAVAAALIVVGLRRQPPLLVALVAASLAAVGFTMYDGGPLRTHLDVIAVTVILFVVTLVTCADPPWRVQAAGSGRTGR